MFYGSVYMLFRGILLTKKSQKMLPIALTICMGRDVISTVFNGTNKTLEVIIIMS